MGVGWCADPGDPQSIAAALRTALAERGRASLGKRLARAASQLSWEREKKGLLTLYEELGRRAPAGGERAL
jgi:glycosyltransferase involved in cell wall biosynthesis